MQLRSIGSGFAAARPCLKPVRPERKAAGTQTCPPVALKLPAVRSASKDVKQEIKPDTTKQPDKQEALSPWLQRNSSLVSVASLILTLTTIFWRASATETRLEISTDQLRSDITQLRTDVTQRLDRLDSRIDAVLLYLCRLPLPLPSEKECSGQLLWIQSASGSSWPT